jgi:hypothetical protein
VISGIKHKNMEERKTAAIVLSILALIAIFFIKILPYIRHKSTQTLSFKTCTVNFKYWDKASDYDNYRAAKNKLALCLCNVYEKKPDSAIGQQILKIYREYDSHSANDSLTYNNTTNVDSVVKNKTMAFDTLITFD